VIIINSIYQYFKPEGVRQFVNNKNLKTIKKGWKGNVKIGDEYANGDIRDEQIMP
jgi:hypothetical protein